MVAEFVQCTLLSRCPQYVQKRARRCLPNASGVEPIVLLYGKTGKRLPYDVFFGALAELDVGYLNTELLRLESG